MVKEKNRKKINRKKIKEAEGEKEEKIWGGRGAGGTGRECDGGERKEEEEEEEEEEEGKKEKKLIKHPIPI